jgi:glycosyltransferase involved in cell wall biosynthesis
MESIISTASTGKVSLCLNMIVKNESRIITRLLESVLPIIDTYVICDTGSTDGTPDIIRKFFDSKGIPGEVIHEPFKNFGYNRTFALRAARGRATYALLLDADMIFKVEPGFNKQSLTAESYLIIQKGGNLSYHNTRLIRLDIDAKCIGPTHEYYDLPPGSRAEKLDTIWINDIGDGGAKADKFERDIRLLKQGIDEEPNNGRYYFYLANSYFNTGRHEESIHYYKRRIELGGWSEEVFYSHLNLGHAYKSIGQDEMAICTWMNGYNTHPSRAETIYQIAKYYREKGKNKIGMAFALLAKQIPYPKNDTLFIHNDVYETGIDYELSILGHYNNYPNLHKIIYQLMNKMPHLWENLLSNYKFCYPKLAPYLVKKIGGVPIKEKINVCGTEYEMFGSNPCIFKVQPTLENPSASRYMINIRIVNYHLNYNGSYHFPVDDGKIVTVNQIWNLDVDTLEKVGKPIYLIPQTNSLRYIGIEDWKPYPYSNVAHEGKWPYLGTAQCPRTGNISIGYGVFNSNQGEEPLDYKIVETKWNKGCEKNWVFCGADSHVIYQWFPLTIGKIVPNPNPERNDTMYLEIIEERQMPNFFRHIRGSTHGYEFEDEVWFLAHAVEYGTPRIYYHFFVIFKKEWKNNDNNAESNKNNEKAEYSLKLDRWSNLFSFEGEKIEYALGLIVEEKRIIVSYSKWDREPCIGVYDKFKVEMELF